MMTQIVSSYPQKGAEGMNLEGTVRKENGLWPDIRAEEQEALHREHPELNGGSAITDGRLATSQVYRDHSGKSGDTGAESKK